MSMSNPVYRATVVYSNSTTGQITVRIPSLAGADSTFDISYIGRAAVSGLWAVPDIGDQIVVTADDANFTNTFWVQTNPSSLSLGNVSLEEIGYLDGVTSNIQTQLNSKAPAASPTFTGTVVLPSSTSVGSVDSSEIGYLDGVTSNLQTQLNSKINSVTGTTNRVTATTTSGAVTLNLPQDIHTGASPTFGGLTSTGNVTVSKRNPVLQIEETGGADNVDINLYQSGSSTEGLNIRYESGTGHSRIKNIYSAGSLYLHSANSTNTGLEIDSSGRNRVVQGYSYSRAGQMVGTARAVAGSRATSSGTFSVGGTWTTLASQSVFNSTINASYVAVHFYFSCYVTTGGNCRSKIVIRYAGTDWQIAEAYHYFNPTYQHMMWHNNAILLVPGGQDYEIQCQVYGFTTLNFNGDDSYGFVAFAA